MSVVSNNLFKELQPIELEKDPFWLIKKGFVFVSVGAFFTVIGSGIGFSFGMAEIGFSMVSGGIGGAIVGAIAAIAVFFFLRYETPLEKYQIKTLQQIESLQNHPKAMPAIQRLKRLFSQGLEFNYPYEVHDMYADLASITENIPSFRPDVYKIWELFLKKIPEAKAKVYKKPEVALDSEIELKRLKNVSIPLTTSKLNVRSAQGLRDLEALEALGKLCFPDFGEISKDQMRELLLKHDSNRCLVMKQKQSGQILGYVWSCKREQGHIEIMQLCRHPTAAHLKIGENLMKELLYQLPRNCPIQLHVLKSNVSAQALYQRFGFELKKEEKHYYKRNESALVMELNWGIFEKNVPKNSILNNISRYVWSFLRR